MVGAVVQPEQFGVTLNLRQRRAVDPVRVGEDLLQQIAHRQAVTVALVEVDVAAGQSRLPQVPHQDLVVQRQLLETIGIQLDHGGVVDLLEQILARAGRGRGRGRRCRSVVRLRRSLRSRTGRQHAHHQDAKHARR